MINLTFKEKTPPIDRFPNDDIFRVVWAYGSVQKGSTVTGIPEIHVLLVELTFNDSISEFIPHFSNNLIYFIDYILNIFIIFAL